MTGDAALLFHLQHDDILVAIQTNFLTLCTWPDSSPLCHSRLRERDQYTASPFSTVSAKASRFIQATIKMRAAGRILGNGRYQSLLVPVHGIEPVAHSRTSTPCCFI